MTFEQKLEHIIAGNPGAYTVVMRELAWYSDWHEMVEFLFSKKIWGNLILEHFKDRYYGDTISFAKWIKQSMYSDRAFSHLSEPKDKHAEAMVKKHKIKF